MEFVANDASATVRGANVKATLDALRVLPNFGPSLIERHGLSPDTLRSDTRVPVQCWLDALYDIQNSVGEAALRQTGIRLVENAEFPAQYATVEDVLMALNTIYYMNHRGDVGRYRTERGADGSVVVHCETPYPRNFERGLVEGICRNRRAGSVIYCVEYSEGSGDRTCTLTVHRAG